MTGKGEAHFNHVSGFMNRLNVLHQLILADFRERTRRYSFLLTLLGALFFGYLVITDRYTIQFSEYRSEYNSNWVGTLMAVTCAVMFSIVGFYLVKNSISRDRKTEVGQIIAATPLSRVQYITAKFISNVTVLWMMVALLAAVAFVTLLFRGGPGSVNILAFITPFLLISAPAMVFAASAAVLFDTVKWLRGSFGNILYLFMAEVMLVSGMWKAHFLDLAGIGLFTQSMKAAIMQAFSVTKVGMQMGFLGMFDEIHVNNLKIFSWDGIEWILETVLFRFILIGFAFCIVALAVPFFDRFDPAKVKHKVSRKKKVRAASESSLNDHNAPPAISYASVVVPRTGFSFVRMLKAELRLMLKGYHWFWYGAALALAVAQMATPFGIARMYITPISMIWPLVIWSSMGTRESRYNTGQLLLSSPWPVTRQLSAIWTGGLVIALTSICMMLIRSIIIGEWTYMITLLAAALFIPSVALALGTLSGSKKLFEVPYLTVWYVGSIDHIAPLDLLGTTDAAINPAKIVLILALTVMMIWIALLARRRQVIG
jgi:hypothetical protein